MFVVHCVYQPSVPYAYLSNEFQIKSELVVGTLPYVIVLPLKSPYQKGVDFFFLFAGLKKCIIENNHRPFFFNRIVQCTKIKDEQVSVISMQTTFSEN